jgi:kynurenine formamidase
MLVHNKYVRFLGARVFDMNHATVKSTTKAHRVMREREYYHLENNVQPARIPLPYHSFTASVLPVNWRGASVAPVRVAMIRE